MIGYQIRVRKIGKKDDRCCPICGKSIRDTTSKYLIYSMEKVFHIRCYKDEEYERLLIEGVLTDEDKMNIEKEFKAYTKEIMVEYF